MTELDRLVWVDIETTGLDPTKNLILEVGIVITDLNLDVLDDFQCTVWDTPKYDKWLASVPDDDWCKVQHTQSGLLAEAQAKGVLINRLPYEVCDFLQGHGIIKETREPMCGSSVQFDRGFLSEQFPEIEEHFSYRNIDTSSVKELCMRYNPELYAKLDVVTQPKKLHRVLPDIADTIDEFKFYRDNFLFVGDF